MSNDCSFMFDSIFFYKATAKLKEVTYNNSSLIDSNYSVEKMGAS